VCAWIRGFAKLFPLARSRAWRYHGCALWQAGRESAARRAWQRALVEARALGLKYDEGLALLELASRTPEQGPERHVQLEAARVIFRDCAAGHDLDRVEQLAGELSGATGLGGLQTVG
jgi:hypothetical protein